MNIKKLFYKYTIIFLLLIPTISFALIRNKPRRFYVYNLTNTDLYVYFMAKGCVGIAGKHGCKYKGFPLQQVCAHKYVMPGCMYSHKFMKGKTFLAYAFCKANTNNSAIYALGRYNTHLIEEQDGTFYGNN